MADATGLLDRARPGIGIGLRRGKGRAAAWDQQGGAAPVLGRRDRGGRCGVSTVPPRVLEAVRDVLVQHAEDLGIDRATVTARRSQAVTARRRDGGLLRLDVSSYDNSELSR